MFKCSRREKQCKVEIFNFQLLGNNGNGTLIQIIKKEPFQFVCVCDV